MKTFGWIFAMTLALGASASADGFNCEGLTFGNQIEVFNKNNPAEGTRNVDFMAISQPVNYPGPRIIAIFNKEQGLLIQKGATYIAKVDGRFKVPQNASKKVGGMNLGELTTVRLAVNFNYSTDTPSHAGDKYSAVVFYTKEDGAVISENATCIRYKRK